MKAKVIQQFTCKIIRYNYKPGDLYEGSAERIAELVSKGKVEAEQPEKVETTHIPKAEKPKPKKNVKK